MVACTVQYRTQCLSGRNERPIRGDLGCPGMAFVSEYLACSVTSCVSGTSVILTSRAPHSAQIRCPICTLHNDSTARLLRIHPFTIYRCSSPTNHRVSVACVQLNAKQCREAPEYQRAPLSSRADNSFTCAFHPSSSGGHQATITLHERCEEPRKPLLDGVEGVRPARLHHRQVVSAGELQGCHGRRGGAWSATGPT